MRNPRHLLILLGFICQSLSWEGGAVLLANVALWLVFAGLLRGRVQLPSWLDPVILLGGCVAGYLFCKMAGQSPHFFLGHGMTALQAVRLLRPLNRREKIYSVLMALFQIGVACTILFDYRFMAVLVAAVVLIPQTLRELELEKLPEGLGSSSATASPTAVVRPEVQPVYRSEPADSEGRVWSKRWARARAYLVIAALMMLFFLLFPRGLLPGLQARPSGLRSQGGLLDSILDPAAGGGALSSRVLLQIEGQKIGYLRAHTLTDFDGAQWRAGSQPLMVGIPRQPSASDRNLLSRRVRVKQLRYLGGALPADGFAMAASGKFFRRVSRNDQDLLRSSYLLNTSDTGYQYWTDPSSAGTNFYRWQLRGLTNAPVASERLRSWVNELTAGSTNALQRARRLELHLQDNFTYRIGAPDLNRLNTLEDFLFNRKEGHCERFASALALLLRQQGIPTRIGLGYVPGAPNRVSGWQSVRFRDAHAWTEAWFPELGWLIFDATPRSRLPQPDWQLTDVLDAIDLGWSSFVLNFDQSTQNYLLGSALKSVSDLFGLAHRHPEYLVLLLAPAVLVLLVRKKGRWNWKLARRQSQAPDEVVSHFYGEMLGALAKAGYRRLPHQTPIEFLEELERRGAPALERIRSITQQFCRVYYGPAGDSMAEPALTNEIATWLEDLNRALGRK